MIKCLIYVVFYILVFVYQANAQSISESEMGSSVALSFEEFDQNNAISSMSYPKVRSQNFLIPLEFSKQPATPK